jgi:hypothetical protein
LSAELQTPLDGSRTIAPSFEAVAAHSLQPLSPTIFDPAYSSVLKSVVGPKGVLEQGK